MFKPVMSGVAIVLAATGVVAAQAQTQDDLEQVKARQRIATMEAVLERAVSNGADNMLRRMREVMPEAPMLSGQPQVRGFRLDGVGVFFDVDVPALRIPMSWTLRYMVDQNGVSASAALADLSAMVRNVREPNERARLQQAIQRLELQVGPAPRAAARTSAAGPTTTLAAQSVTSGASVPVPVAPVDAGVVEDPTEAFTREVKAALIEAMLENSGPIAVRADEWLWVAARDNIRPDPLLPSDATDLHTLMFRVKGSDLADFHARRITAEDARKRVEVREDRARDGNYPALAGVFSGVDMYNRAMMPRVVLGLVLALSLSACSSREVEKDLKITDVHTGWYDAGIVEGNKNKLVPSISLKLANVSSEAIDGVQINAIFRRTGENEMWGEHLVRAIGSNGLAAGKSGGNLVLRSKLGYTGTESRGQMLANKAFVDAKVEIFGKTGRRNWVKMGEFPIERKLLTE